jgi:hypothetical protein
VTVDRADVRFRVERGVCRLEVVLEPVDQNSQSDPISAGFPSSQGRANTVDGLGELTAMKTVLRDDVRRESQDRPPGG